MSEGAHEKYKQASKRLKKGLESVEYWSSEPGQDEKKMTRRGFAHNLGAATGAIGSIGIPTAYIVNNETMKDERLREKHASELRAERRARALIERDSALFESRDFLKDVFLEEEEVQGNMRTILRRSEIQDSECGGLTRGEYIQKHFLPDSMKEIPEAVRDEMRDFLVMGNVSQESLLDKEVRGDPVQIKGAAEGETERAQGLFQIMPSTYAQFNKNGQNPRFTEESMKRVDVQVECANENILLNYKTIIRLAGPSLKNIQEQYWGTGSEAKERFEREFLSLVLLNAHIFGAAMSDIVTWFAENNDKRVSRYNVFRTMITDYAEIPKEKRTENGRSFGAHSKSYVLRCFAYAMQYTEKRKQSSGGKMEVASLD